MGTEPGANLDAGLQRGAHNLRVDRFAAEAVAALDAAGVDSILLKGASFATWLYPTGGRAYGDVDLLVPRSQVMRAAAVLNGLGYYDGQEGYSLIERHPEASEFVRPQQRVLIDLHTNLHWLPDPDRTWSVLWRETEPMLFGDVPVRVLNAAGRAMHVALHAAHHGLAGPQPHDRGGQTGEDLRRALAVVSLVEWQRAHTIAIAIDAEAAFGFGLRLEAEGLPIADALGLTADAVPDVWTQRAPFHEARERGVHTFYRLATAHDARAKAVLVARWLVPSRARARAAADTRVGRATTPGAYLEYWYDALVSLPTAVRGLGRLRKGGL